MAIKEILTEIYNEYGYLTPQLVVELAKEKTHPLHSSFDWNDKSAGEKYRIEQANALIRKVKIVFKPGTEKSAPQRIRAFVAPQAEDKPNEYMPIEEAMADPLTSMLILRQMEREWKELKRRYGHYVEFTALVQSFVEEKSA